MTKVAKKRAGKGVNVAPLALATGLVPLLVVHIAFVSSAISGYVPLCLPYLDGCASISASGRQGFSYIFFKLGMIPAAILLALFWLTSGRWLHQYSENRHAVWNAMVVSGCLSAIFLMIYTVYLGSKGELYQFMRRTGVIIYFSGSYIAQLLLLARLQRLQGRKIIMLAPYILRAKLTIVGALMVFGLTSIPVGNFVTDKDRLENIIEWGFSLLMISYYFFTWLAWRQTRLSLHFKPLRVIPGG